MRKTGRCALIPGLVLCVMPYAAWAEEAAPAMTVDLTEVVIAAMMLTFDLILTWAARTLLPVVGEWLKARTTEEQRRLLYELTESLVAAAEQLFGAGRGKEKLDYVMEGLAKRGMTADVDLIEAAVRGMNRKALQTVELTLGTGTGRQYAESEAAEEAK